MAEFSELRGLRTRELESIKSFMTMQIDEWIPKYKEFRVSYPRRFLAIGTTNEQEFLNDPTGNRRWLPIAVSIQDLDAIDRDHDQLWAEAALLFLHHGVCWEDAHTRAEAEHAAFCIHDPWTELVTEYCASKVAAMVHPDLDVPYVHIPTFLPERAGDRPRQADGRPCSVCAIISSHSAGGMAPTRSGASAPKSGYRRTRRRSHDGTDANRW